MLTWRGTFSASQFILDDLDRLSQAVFVGEPASSKPSSFGDAYKTPLPNSGIAVRTSIKWWQEGQNFEPWTYVEIAAPLRFADYAAGRDPALEAALSYEGKPTLPELLLQTKTAADALQNLDAFLADPRNRYINLERHMLVAAEQLSMADRSEEALLVAERAARRFPRSHDAHLVHAFVADRAGRLQLAADAARRAIAVDPDSRQARSILERVEQKRAPARQ